jgi:hypothetical protein
MCYFNETKQSILYEKQLEELTRPTVITYGANFKTLYE